MGWERKRKTRNQEEDAEEEPVVKSAVKGVCEKGIDGRRWHEQEEEKFTRKRE